MNTMINLSNMAIDTMSLDQIKTELIQRYRIAKINGQDIEIEGTRAQLEKALLDTRKERAA